MTGGGRRGWAALLLLALLVVPLPATAGAPSPLEEAIRLYEAGDYPRAQRLLQEVVAAQPQNQTALYYLGVTLYYRQRYEEAIPYLERAAAGPQPLEGLEGFLAGLYLYVGQAGKALPYYARRYRADPTDEEALYGYAFGLRGSGRADEARSLLRQLASGEGEMADAARYELATLLAEEGSYVAALRWLGRIGPDSAYAGAASAYTESLAPYGRPLIPFGVLELFYDDNPASASSDRLGRQGSAGGSQGAAFTAVLDTRRQPLSDQWSVALRYLFYGLFYREREARAYEYSSQSLTPDLRWQLRHDLGLVAALDFGTARYGGQPYSRSGGIALGAEWKRGPGRLSTLRLSCARTRYTDNYGSAGVTSSLQYLDADGCALALGTTVPLGSANLDLGYTYSDEKTLRRDEPGLGTWARDSRSRSHALSAAILWPLPEWARGSRLRATTRYSQRRYPYPQSGELYPAVAGQRLSVELLTLGLRVERALGRHLTLAAGIDHTRSRSDEPAFDYRRRRYLIQISAH